LFLILGKRMRELLYTPKIIAQKLYWLVLNCLFVCAGIDLCRAGNLCSRAGKPICSTLDFIDLQVDLFFDQLRELVFS